MSATRTENGFEFRFQVRKYYGFDSQFKVPAMGALSLSDLTRLNDTGLAQNYWIFGQSNTFTATQAP
jgi:hypothetical protein